MSEGIKKMQKKDLYGVSVALNSIDPAKTIDGKICKTAYKHSGTQGQEADNMCGVKMDRSDQSSNSKTGLAELWNTGGSGATDRGGGYDKNSSETIGPKTSVKISTDINGLTKDEKSKVSSAFARGGEGAEIVEIRSITKKNMHDVAQSIEQQAADGSFKDGKKIGCYDTGGSNPADGSSRKGVCIAKSTGHDSNGGALIKAYPHGSDGAKIEDASAKHISSEITSSKLTRADKGVVSSAFAKADASGNNVGQDIHH